MGGVGGRLESLNEDAVTDHCFVLGVELEGRSGGDDETIEGLEMARGDDLWAQVGQSGCCGRRAAKRPAARAQRPFLPP